MAVQPPVSGQYPQKSLKRDASHLSSPSTQDSLFSSQPTKRLRVAFDDNVDVRIMDDWNTKPVELVREEVRSAIEGHLRTGDEQDNTGYEQLRMIFVGAGTTQDPSRRDSEKAGYADERPNTALLKQYIAALTQRVSELRHCGSLIMAVMDINWVGREETFVATYTRFLAALGSAVPGVLRTVLDRMVRLFVNLPSSYGRILGEPYISRPEMVGRLHGVIRYLQRLIPAVSTSLAEVLRHEFPNHRTVDKRSYVGYVKNILRIAEYAPELKGEILTLITERVIKLDVEVQEEIDDLEEEEEEMVVTGDTEGVDIDDDMSDAESEASSEASVTPEERHLKTLRETVGKMDAILDLLFAHYTNAFLDGTRLQAADTYLHLLSQFENFILPTYRSRHTQFLVFHFSQLSQYNIGLFLDTLVRIAFRRATPSHSALSAIAYLSSFIARGAHISRDTVRDIFVLLGDQLTAFRLAYAPACRGPDLSRYALFYAIAQAMLYIYCFRWRDLIVLEPGQDADADDYDVFEQGEPIWIPGIKEALHQNIYSPLNPLKVCAPPIVSQFAAIANHLRFLYVFPLLETNKRLRLSSYRGIGPQLGTGGVGEMGVGKREGALAGKKGEQHHQLDAFFPFDPYQLRKSGRWMEGDYNVWKGVPGMNNGAEDSEDEDEEESEDEEFYEDEVQDLDAVSESS